MENSARSVTATGRMDETQTGQDWTEYGGKKIEAPLDDPLLG
jgi:hypothetical protein